MYSGRELQEAQDVTAMVYTYTISAFFNKNIRQRVTHFASFLFNTQLKAIQHDGHIQHSKIS